MSPQAALKMAPGKTGAKVTSFDENAARAFVKRVMDEYPTAGRDEVVRRVRDQVTGRHNKYLPSFIDYATINAWRVIRDGEKAAAADRRGEPNNVTDLHPASKPTNDTGSATHATETPTSPVKPPLQVEQERHDAELKRIAQQETTKAHVKTVLLDLLAPNGKLWRDLTLAEYMAIGKKQFDHGKQMLRRGHKRTELLATATTEAEIQKVFK